MALFESTLTLLFIAVLLLQVSRRLSVPYPTVLALAGAGVATLPWAPDVVMDPHLALVLFISPALLDAAYDTPPRELRRNWLPLVSLALVAVVVTTAAVAWAGWAFAGLPIAAAIALGAIVAPPDAAAAAAVLTRLDLPRQALTILKAESLLNDAAALLIFSAALSLATSSASLAGLLPMLLIAAPGGVIIGLVLGYAYLAVAPRFAGTLGARIIEFGTTFAVWIVAERLHASAILAVVAYAMVVAHYTPERQSARDRVHSYSVWEAVVFVLNVLAFLLMGLQARIIFSRLQGPEFWEAIGFAALVLGIVIFVRIAWVMGSGPLLAAFLRARKSQLPILTWRERVLVSWCGMRGLVTLAIAFALPVDFPGRDVILLSAFAVVLGTLVLQGMTVTPLIRLLKIPADRSLEAEVSLGRTALVEAALAALAQEAGAAAEAVRAEYEAAGRVAKDPSDPQASTEYDILRSQAIASQRKALAKLRREGRITDDAFHRLEEELDWDELSATPRARLELVEG